MGLIANDQQKNSMASFDFSFPAIDAGTTFVFGSWACIANGSDGFDSHLTNTMSPEGSQEKQLDETSSTEFLLPELTSKIEK